MRAFFASSGGCCSYRSGSNTGTVISFVSRRPLELEKVSVSRTVRLKIDAIGRLQRRIGWISAYGGCYVGLLLMSKKGHLPADRWRLDKTDPHCSVALPKVIFFLPLQEKSYCQATIIIPGASTH